MPIPSACALIWSNARSSTGAELFSPEFKGKAALQDHPLRSALSMSRWRWKPAGAIKYADKGNMTRAEIDKTIALMMDIKKLEASSDRSGRRSTNR